jgi:hypothetical protein
MFRAAKLLIDQDGDDAHLRAALRADELLDAGDMNGAATWRRILAAIEVLSRGNDKGNPTPWAPQAAIATAP